MSRGCILMVDICDSGLISVNYMMTGTVIICSNDDHLIALSYMLWHREPDWDIMYVIAVHIDKMKIPLSIFICMLHGCEMPHLHILCYGKSDSVIISESPDDMNDKTPICQSQLQYE